MKLFFSLCLCPFVLFASLLTASVSGAEANAKARVDFLLRDNLEVDVVSFHGAGAEVKEASWSDQKHLILTLPATRTWQSASITLQARADGRIALIPMSDQQSSVAPKSEPTFILFDAFTSSDSSLQNGSFETLDGKGTPAWWYGPDGAQLDDSRKASVVSVGALEGGRCIRVWHGSKYVQGISLKAGVPLTITFYYRQE